MSSSFRRPGESEPFRDADPGARARRRDLLTRRRDDLATMPHTVRGVYVGRFARIGASVATIAVGILLLAAANVPAVHAVLVMFGPPPEPAMLLTCLMGAWLAGAMAYLLVRCYAEHRFSLTMARAVLPTSNLYDDVERLTHVWPHRVARFMAHRLETPAAALPVFAFAVVGPASAYYLVEALMVGGYPDPNWIEFVLVDDGPLALALACLGGLSAVGLSVLGARRRAVLAGGGLAALAAPFAGLGFALWAAVLCVAVVGAAVWLTGRERERIDSEDLAVEPFDLSAFLRDGARRAWSVVVLVARTDYPALVRRGLRAVRVHWRESIVLAVSAAVIAAFTVGPRIGRSAESPHSDPWLPPATAVTAPAATATGGPDMSGPSLVGDDAGVVTRFVATTPVTNRNRTMFGLAETDAAIASDVGYSGAVTITLLSGDGDGDLLVRPEGDVYSLRRFTATEREVVWQFDCAPSFPSRFTAERTDDASPHEIAVHIEPSIRLEACER